MKLNQLQFFELKFKFISMANRRISFALRFLLLLLILLCNDSNQLHPSQYQALLSIRQQLNNIILPQQDSHITNSRTESQDVDDPCASDPTPQQTPITLACFEDDITQLHVTGIPNARFSPRSSTPALFSSIAQLPNLKILSLVSLGLRGPLPPEVGFLSSLEVLNVSSNALDGPIPGELSSIRSLQTLILDHNSFAGPVPEWLASLPALSVLSLRNNSFNGSFPNALSGVATLRTLVLSGNNLSGKVPGLLGLTNLHVLDLGNNSLGPEFPTLPRKLVSLVLRMNKFRVVLYDELSSCYQLRKVDVSSNQLAGTLSPSLLSLPSLVYLDVSANRFTGRLARNMSTCSVSLKFVNFSGNRLTGDLPDCLNSVDSVSYEGNCLLGRNMRPQQPLPFCHVEALSVGFSNEEKRKRPNRRVVVVVASVVAVFGAVVLVGLLGLFLFAKRRQPNVNKVSHTKFIVDKVSPAYTLQLLRDARYISQTIKLGALGIPPYRTFVLDELREATSNFSALHLIGEGSYGQVYKGCLTDGSVVAIRSLRVKKRQGAHTYTHQLEMISKLRHCHLVSAIGHCFQCYQDDSTVSRIFLVFEFGPNGTLRSWIAPDSQSGRKFTWTQRIAAGIGVARGIQYLHTGIVPGVYSNRLKINDILLDGDLHVKISKYNLPLLTENRRPDEPHVLSRGSKENLESMSGCEEKNDVYDFGVILLELIVGRPIISVNDVTISRDILSVSLKADGIGRRSIMDPAVQKECSDESIKTVVDLCIRCLSKEPSVEDVIWNLQFAAQLQEAWYRDSPSNN